MIKNNISNKTRSILLSYINKEIIMNFKREFQIRINSKKLIDLYNKSNENFEVNIKKKFEMFNKVYDFSATKYKRKSLTFFPLDELNEKEREKDLKYLHFLKNKKVLCSQKKLKYIEPEISKKILFENIKDSIKVNLLKLRKITNDIINTKVILEKFKQENNNIDNNNNNKNNIEKKIKNRKKVKNLTFNIEKDFKINLNICQKLGNNELFDDENANSFAYRNNNYLEKNNNYFENKSKNEKNSRRKKKNHSCVNHNEKYIKECLGDTINDI